MRQSPVLLPALSSFLVVAAYASRQTLQQSGLPFDPYYAALFLLPASLILFKNFSFGDLGLRTGKPLTGIFFVLLLPGILFLRWSLLGKSMTPFASLPVAMMIVGSFAEEFFFRGYLQEDFRKRFGGNVWPSLALSNVIFALVHLVKGYSLLPAAMTGIIGVYFGIAKDKQGGNSLIYSMAAHGLYNLVAASVVM